MKTHRRTRRALLGLVTALSMTLLLLTTALAGVTEVTGGSGVTVKTTVRENYTDTYQKMTFDLKKGDNTFDGAGGYFSTNSGTLTVGFPDLGLVDITYSVTADTVVMTVSNYDDLPSGVYTCPQQEDEAMMTTTRTGSKLTYTGTDYDENGGVLINEIRDDYYNRHHILRGYTLTVTHGSGSGTGSGGSGTGGSGSGSSGSGSSGTGLTGAGGGYSSPKTFDAGVALYAAAAVLSGSGAAVLRRKRR